MGDDNKKTDYAPGARYCSKQAAGELFFTNFLHSVSALTGCSEVIDTYVKTDHYHALESKKTELESAMEGARWTAIQTIMAIQTSKKAQDDVQADNTNKYDTTTGVDEETITTLKDFIFKMDKDNELNKTKIENRLKLINFSTISNTIFLYIITFVLLVFVDWN